MIIKHDSIMKRFLYFAGIVSVLLGGQACTNEVLIEHENGIMTRAIVDESHASTSNPDLLTNWENLEYVVLNKVNADETVDKATLPWRNGAQTLLPPTF